MLDIKCGCCDLSGRHVKSVTHRAETPICRQQQYQQRIAVMATAGQPPLQTWPRP